MSGSGRKALFLSYDGMTDPLGGSQVIPYLRGLAARGHEISIVSAEKPARYAEHAEAIGRQLREDGLAWHPVMYHKRPPILSTVWDLRALSRTARGVVGEKGIEIIHCRSYVPALVGLGLKRRRQTRFIFDMRGFWADERVDGGLWKLDRLPYRLAYDYFKRQERHFLEESDRTVSLTHAGRAEMGKWGLSEAALARIDVIPCCADLEHFRRDRVDAAERARRQAGLGLNDGDFVVSYLGSIGTWYLLDEMLAFFRELRQSRPGAKFLFITPDDPAQVRAAAERAGVPAQGADSALRIVEAKRAEVPVLLSLSQLGLFFIKPAYSKLSSSPTKLAEILAMGIPVVSNAGVGDSEWLAERFRVGPVVKEFTPGEYARAVAELPAALALEPARIRAAAESCFSLEQGVQAYDRIYQSLGRSI